MATVVTSLPQATGNIAGFRILSFISNVKTWNERRMTRKALSTLTDRELDDIGLNRGDIASL